jgi:hypothetical protein
LRFTAMTAASKRPRNPMSRMERPIMSELGEMKTW